MLKTTVASEDIAPQRRKILQRFVHIWCQYPTVAGINSNPQWFEKSNSVS